MAGTKEIRLKIKSVQGTRKITKAMEMVAASKMRKAQERMRQFRPYGDKIRNIVAHLAQANPEYRPPFLQKRESIKAVGIILVTTDKGLCGGLNTNIQRAVLQRIKELDAQGVKAQTTAIGNKGFGFLQRLNASIVSQYVQIGDRPQLEKMIGPVKALVDMALASLKAASPLPPPPPVLLVRGNLVFSETWLVQNDNTFRVRTLTLPQE